MNVKDYCVYEHVFPNGKKYIGITKDPEKRFANGYGYSQQKKVYRAIKKYGWENIKHNILVDGLTIEQAKTLEKSLIRSMDTFKNGYNQTLGGDGRQQTYLKPYVTAMINEFLARHSDAEGTLPYLYNSLKLDEECAEFINASAYAVTEKHGEFSPTDDFELDEFWYHMLAFLCLHRGLDEGRNPRKFSEKHYVQFRWWSFFCDKNGKTCMDFFWGTKEQINADCNVTV